MNDKKDHKIPDEGLEQMKHAILAAKAEKNRKKRLHRKKMCEGTVVFLIAAVVIAPNTSVDAAYALSDIPVVGNLFEAVTFRDFHYEGERFQADVSIPKLVKVSNPKSESQQTADGKNTPKVETADDAEAINQKMEKIGGKLVAEFTESVTDGKGASGLYVNYEIINTTQRYFTVKLITYQSAGSGYEKDYFYTLDLTTGKELQLKDLFKDGTDYVTPISENIKAQMRKQMADDKSVTYWIDIDKSDAVYEWTFDKIEEDQQVYVDKEGRVVIAFSEGDVAPMYIGEVTFTIPASVTADIMTG